MSTGLARKAGHLFFVPLTVLFVVLPAVFYGYCSADMEVYFEEGNRLYDQGDHARSAEKYEKARLSGYVSPALYYNLAGAYFKSGDMGRSVLNYERALALAPRDPDIAANYVFVRSMLPGRSAGMADFIFPREIRAYSRFFTANELTILSSVAFLGIFLFLAAAAIFRRSRKKIMLIVFLLTIFTAVNSFIVMSKVRDLDSYAVIVVPSANALYGPFDSATRFFTLREGDGVMITQSSGEWYRVKRQDGTEGWVDSSSLERI